MRQPVADGRPTRKPAWDGGGGHLDWASGLEATEACKGQDDPAARPDSRVGGLGSLELLAPSACCSPSGSSGARRRRWPVAAGPWDSSNPQVARAPIILSLGPRTRAPPAEPRLSTVSRDNRLLAERGPARSGYPPLPRTLTVTPSRPLSAGASLQLRFGNSIFLQCPPSKAEG